MGSYDGKHVRVLEVQGLTEWHKHLIKQTNQKFHPAGLTAKAYAVTKVRTHLILRLKRKKNSVAGRGATRFL